MKIIDVIHVGRYTVPERNRQTLYKPWIAFQNRGFEQINLYSETGELIFDGTEQQPFIMFGIVNSLLEFKAGEDRENWVVMLGDLDSFKMAEKPRSVVMTYDQTELILPMIIPIKSERREYWRGKFMFLTDLWKEPIPFNKFRVECGVVEILFQLLNEINPSVDETRSPEGRLKRLIDDDRPSRYNLSELSEKCGYSNDYLRLLFQKRYQISPMTYRRKQRMAYAMELITSSHYSVKEIATKTGFRHESHFCTAFKEEFAQTPFQAIRSYRQG